MADQQNTSPEEQNRILARKIGDALPHIDQLDPKSDPLLPLLLSYKKEQKSRLQSVDSDFVWSTIEKHISESSSRSASVLPMFSAYRRYAAAAVIIIASLIGLFVYQSGIETELVGESLAEIEILHLADGSTVTLRPYSKLFKESFSDEKHQYHLEGEAYFEIVSNTNRVFAVNTSRANVEVLGTKFILSDWGNVSSVFLEEGRIQYAALSTQQSIILTKGQSAKVSQKTGEPQLSESEAEVHKDWLTGELIFQNEPAYMVLSELEQHFNITIQVPAAGLDEELSGSLQLDELNAVLHDLELVLNGTFEVTGKGNYEFIPN